MRNFLWSALLFVTVFVVVTLGIVWGPLLFAQQPAPPCTGERECEHDATGEEQNDAAWQRVDLFGQAGEPRLCTIEVALQRAEERLQSCDHEGIPNAEYVTEFAPSSRIRKAADSVGRVQFLLKRKNGRAVKTTCTAFLIAPDALLTAKHCIELSDAAGPPIRTAIRFRYLAQAGAEGEFFELTPVGIEKDPSAKAADFIVLRLNGDAAAKIAAAGIKPLPLEAKPVTPGDDLFIVGHPFGVAQVALRSHCRAHGDSTAGANIIEHSCGTASGISGGPIFSDATGAVVGIHIQAQDKIQDEVVDLGYGLPITLIAERSPAVKALLVAQPPSPPTP